MRPPTGRSAIVTPRLYGHAEATVDILVTSVADHPEFGPLLEDLPADSWPEFMYHDPLASLIYGHATSRYAEFSLVAIDRDRPGQALARAYSVPFTGDLVDLPADGWDAVMLNATNAQLSGVRGNLVSALEVTVRPDARGTGLAVAMLAGLVNNAARLGYTDLVTPLRPTRKTEHPDMPMDDYIAWMREDGLPTDPWLRTHVRAGGEVLGVAPRSMTITGSLAQWRAWTGLPFDRTGPVTVPGALVPVHCDVTADLAVYVEPNVWVRHRTPAGR
jgi:GNAT superfamily N-acetyltransferase